MTIIVCVGGAARLEKAVRVTGGTGTALTPTLTRPKQANSHDRPFWLTPLLVSIRLRRHATNKETLCVLCNLITIEVWHNNPVQAKMRAGARSLQLKCRIESESTVDDG
jgi:hypothetical protein